MINLIANGPRGSFLYLFTCLPACKVNEVAGGVFVRQRLPRDRIELSVKRLEICRLLPLKHCPGFPSPSHQLHPCSP